MTYEPRKREKPADTSAKTRLQKALRYLEMARTSRELTYSSVPYVRAAEYLLQAALAEQHAL